jgi:PAS domain S-box-containing protein
VRSAEHPHTMLGESIRAFADEIENVTRRLSSLSTPDAAAAEAVTDAVERLRTAQTEVAAEADELRQLLESERLRYRDLFEWAPDAYLVTDPRGTVREANRAAERLLGRSREFLIGKPLATLLARPERKAFRIMLDRLATLEVVSDWDLSFQRADRSAFAAAVTVSAMRDRHDVLVGLRWLVRDVSEQHAEVERVRSANIELDRRVARRTAELEAVAHEKNEALGRLEAVLDQIPAAIVIADAESGRVVAANEHAAALVKSVAGDVNALDTWLNLGFHPEGRPFDPKERPLLRAMAVGESIDSAEIEFHKLDGSTVLYETSAAPIRNLQGDLVGAVAAYWDLTERVRLSRIEREFVTNAAHELRTPLAALASAVEVLQSGAKEDEHQRERFLAHIEQQSQRLQRLVQSLLLLARVQTLREEVDREPIPVRALLETVASFGPDGRVRVETPQADAVVLANRDLVEQALLNLLSNAVKYAPESEIVLTGHADNGQVVLEVSDSGPGMTDEEQARAADRFFRGRDSADGFGLGLSIVQQAAEALDGRLELESEAGTGTKARLLLPSAPTDG